jgi:hypothetical protein
MFLINFIGFLVAIGASKQMAISPTFYLLKRVSVHLSNKHWIWLWSWQKCMWMRYYSRLKFDAIPCYGNLCYIKPLFIRFLLEHVARMSPKLYLLCWSFLPRINQAQDYKLTDFFMTGWRVKIILFCSNAKVKTTSKNNKLKGSCHNYNREELYNNFGRL